MNSSYSTQNDLLLITLTKYYNTFDEDGIYYPNNNLDKVLKIIQGESKISLRIIDWFATNYAKKNFTVYNCKDAVTSKERRFKVYDDYKLKLKAYGKKRFDPFCRRNRIGIPYRHEGEKIETTIGQLNFFRWALENNVINYIDQNYSAIEADMNARNSASKKIDKSKTRKKREELSILASKSIKKEKVEIEISW